MSNWRQSCLLHGADYNYEQWLHLPQKLNDDLKFMNDASVNVLAVGIFSWSMLESEEGIFNFDWLDGCFEKLHKNGQKIILATPSGSKPAWLSEKYPEVCQMAANGIRRPHGERHNHCRTSVKYRQACVRINTELAQRYGKHPALILWHVSNEYNGMLCYCPQCIAAFHGWLKEKYTTLDALNAAWYTTFWSHRYTKWEQIFPSDNSVHTLMLDWQRFTSDQTIDFFLAESKPLRSITPDIPITANFHGPDVGLDYHKFARYVDIISWDSYPPWHSIPKLRPDGLADGTPDDVPIAIKAGFIHDMCRSFLDKPFLLMESTPSAVNWHGVSKKKRKGMHILSSLQAVAHGSDSVQYFQWRQSRGGTEKFHDAVVTHIGTNDTRIFKEVAQTGSILKKLSTENEASGNVTGTNTESKVAVIYDFQNQWILDNAQLPRNIEKNYQKECIAHYEAFWRANISCDVIGPEFADFNKYKLIVIPMLYMFRSDTAEKIRKFIKQSGTVIATYLTGLVDENDLCFLGGTPGNLTDVFGLVVEETESIADYETLEFSMNGNNYKATHYADRIRLLGANVLGEFTGIEAGFPAITVNNFGEGKAYYICARTVQDFINNFYFDICKENKIDSCVSWDAPSGVSVQKREKNIFVMNFNNSDAEISVGKNEYRNLINDESVGDKIILPPYGLAVIS